MVYHSAFNDEKSANVICNAALLPLKTVFRGPAPPAKADQTDIVDEAINYFRANVMFRNFDVEGPADRVLIWLTLYISQCLNKVTKSPNKGQAVKDLNTLALEAFAVPGDPKFALGAFFSAPKSRDEAERFRQYFLQLRQETAKRLVDRVFTDETSRPSKWWMQFAKRKFMNKNL